MIIGYLSWFERKLEQQMQEKEEVSYSQLEIGRTQVGERFSTQKKDKDVEPAVFVENIDIHFDWYLFLCFFLF